MIISSCGCCCLSKTNMVTSDSEERRRLIRSTPQPVNPHSSYTDPKQFLQDPIINEKVSKPRGESPQYILCTNVSCESRIVWKENKSVLSCNECEREMPVIPAKKGHMYVRCSCQALLTCRKSASETRCKRTACKKVIQLKANDNIGAPWKRFRCCYCLKEFLMNPSAKRCQCPECGRLTSLGKNKSTRYFAGFLVLSILFALGTLVLAFETRKFARGMIWVYFGWDALSILSTVFLIMAFFHWSVKTSKAVSQED